jgi:hypothetical protein
MRARYVWFAVATIALGLLVHGSGTMFGALRDPLGDALWAAMMTWWISAAMPRHRLRTRAQLALAISFAVEFSQMVRLPWLDSLRATTIGHLLLGSGYDPRDLAAYAVGVAAAAIVETAAFGRSKIN